MSSRAGSIELAKAPTIVDVARLAKVSMKTVSRALNGEPHVSDKVRSQVLEAAKALNYRPNMFARSLASTRSYLVGLVCAPPSPAPVYIMTVQEGVLSACEARGYNLLTRTFDPESRGIASRVLQFVERSRVDGLVVVPPLSDNKALTRALVGGHIPHVRVSQSDPVAGSERIGTNEREVSSELTRYLISLGHRQIAFIRGHPAHSGSADRLEGYLDAMREAGIEPESEYIEQGMFSFESGVAAARRLFALRQRPTAVFASNDYMAAGVVNAAHRLGLAIPGDVSVAGFDDAPVAHQIWPALTTVRQPVRELGARAAGMLIGALGGSEAERSVAAPDCSIVHRESTGHATRSSR